MTTYGYWFYNELRYLVGVRPGFHHGDRKDSFAILHTPNHGAMLVKTSSNRLDLFRQDPTCVSCGRVGMLWALQSHNGERPHLNLYHVGEPTRHWKNLSKDGFVLMTKDHIQPKSKGGSNHISNLQVMCSICNGIKGNSTQCLPSRDLIDLVR